MATTTRKTTTKTAAAKTTKTAVKPEVKEEAVVETVEEVIVPVETKPEKRKFEPSDLIPCTNMFAGQTIMIGQKSGIMYSWGDLGETEDVEYQDIMAEILKKSSSYIYEPLIIVEDEELLEQRKDLKKFYEQLYSPDELTDVILRESPSRMKAIIKGLPSGARESVKNIAATMIQNGSLDSVQKIRAIDEIFGTKLMLQTELFN